MTVASYPQGWDAMEKPKKRLNDVVATIPNTEASGGKLFGRLLGEEN